MFVNFGLISLVCWAIVHLLFGFDGLIQFLSGDLHHQWNILLGGINGQEAIFQYPSNPQTVNIHRHLLLNFCIEMGAYGLLSLGLAYAIFKNHSWRAYFVFLIVVGIAELAFFFNLVTTGIIILNAGTLLGPILWLLAVVFIPAGMIKPAKN